MTSTISIMTDTSSISAINKVLQAENESRGKIELCRKQAEEIVENGRYQARRISNRVDERISIVHARTKLNIDSRLAELKQEMASLSRESVLDKKVNDQLIVAIEVLVDELVGDVL